MNNIYLDVLHMRRPPLNYVSPAICDAVFSSTSFPVLTLDPLPGRPAITGLRITFIGTQGDFRLNWDNYPGAICYSVYKLNDANDPFGDYTIIAECIPDPTFDPNEWEIPFNKDEPACYIVTAITLEGESAVSNPICTDGDGDGVPDGFAGDCITNTSPLPNGAVGDPYSTTFLPNGPAAGPQWTITGGAIPAGLSLGLNTGILDGTPTEDGEFVFVVRLTKSGGGFCEETFILTIEPGTCCLGNGSDILCATAPGGMCYDPDDNLIFASLGALLPPPFGDQIAVIDAATDTLLTTITGIGINPVQSVYSPINNRVYAITSQFSDVIVIDPVLQIVEATIPAPGGVSLVNSIPEYDSVNNVIYFLAIDPTPNIYVLSLDPMTNIFSTLVTMPDPSPDQQLWGTKAAYCPTNNQIYVPYTLIGGSTTPSILVFSAAGALVDTIAIPGATGSDLLEQLHFSPDTGFLYYMGLHAVGDDSGFIIINPADNSFVTSVAIGGTSINYAAFSGECGSLCIYLSTNFISQYNAETGDFLCTLDVASFNFGLFQIAAGPDGKIYTPRGTFSEVRSLVPPP